MACASYPGAGGACAGGSLAVATVILPAEADLSSRRSAAAGYEAWLEQPEAAEAAEAADRDEADDVGDEARDDGEDGHVMSVLWIGAALGVLGRSEGSRC